MKKNTSSNAIILIGNGFDLAHDLLTSYSHFADYYLENIILKKLIETTLDEDFFNETYLQEFEKKRYSTITKVNLKEQISRLITHIIISENGKNKSRVQKALEILKEDKALILDIISNEFLGKLYASTPENWFNIEAFYFDQLTSIANPNISIKNSIQKKEKVIKLNKDLNEVKTALKKYLETIEVKKKAHIKTFFNTRCAFK